MKPLPLLLACLLLTATFNLALDIAQAARFALLPPALAQIGPSGSADPTFNARLDRLADPGLLREAARRERARQQDDYRLLTALLGNVTRMNRIGVWRSGLLLALTLGAFIVCLRKGPRTFV